MKKDLLEKIKKRGYWLINFKPPVSNQKLISLDECKNIVERSTVNPSWLDCPHFPTHKGDNAGLEPGENFYQGWVDDKDHKEFWRMYQSGEFILYLALCEDWLEEASEQQNLHEKIKPMSSLRIVEGVEFRMTEIFVFLSQLGTAGIYDDGVHVSITLHNTENRELWMDVNWRKLFHSYKTKKQKIEFIRKYTKEQIMTNPKELAFNAIKHIFDEFGWLNPPVDMIKNYQDKLLNGRN